MQARTLGAASNNIGAPIVNRLHYTAPIVNRLHYTAQHAEHQGTTDQSIVSWCIKHTISLIRYHQLI